MSTRASYFRLGLFMIGALVAGVVILLVLGVGSILRPKVVIETYFDGSVQGLDVGAPVKLRGVTIGEVSNIGFTHVNYERDVPVMERRQYVLVEAVIRPDRLGSSGRIPTPEMVQAMVDRGLRVRMTPQGVTGINFLELDFLDPRMQIPIPIDWVPDNIYVPSAPGTVTQFIEYADNLARRLDRLDVEGIVENMNRLLVSLDASLKALDAPRISEETHAVLNGLRNAVTRMDALLSSPVLAGVPENLGVAAANLRTLSESPRFGQSMDTLDRVMESLERTATGMEGTVQGYEHDLALILDNLRAMSEQLRALSEEASAYPGILLSRPPAPVEHPRQ